MGLVGPRPLLSQYLSRYTIEQSRRHNVRPGITGWAQVNGRNALSWEDKFKFDLEYVENISFSLDVRILWMTAVNVLKRKGISSDGHATTEEFMGSDHS
jgi:lipopolysaccharide/colanic/teichoic acid biosynthesis glycosyltransferase